MDFDPSDADALINLPSLVQKINLPGMGGNEPSLTCFTDDDGNNKCFTVGQSNQIECDKDNCFVNYKTLSQKMLGNGKKIRDLDLDVLINPSGISTTIQLVGSIPRSRLRTLKKIIGNVDVMDVDELPVVSIGMPKPPEKCHLNPLGNGCSQYLSSDDYTFIPMIGFKKRTAIITNPRTIFKSEVIPQIKKMAGVFMNAIRSRKESNGVKKVNNEPPMHVNRIRKVETEKKNPLDP